MLPPEILPIDAKKITGRSASSPATARIKKASGIIKAGRESLNKIPMPTPYTPKSSMKSLERICMGSFAKWERNTITRRIPTRAKIAFHRRFFKSFSNAL